MTVLIVSPRAVAGGAERVVVSLAHQLSRRGLAALTVLGEEGPLRKWLTTAACATTLLPDLGALGEPTPRAGAHLAALIRDSQPQVVIGVCARGHVLAGPPSESAGIPAVWWRMVTPNTAAYDRAAASLRAAAVVCQTQRAVSAQLRLTPDVPCVAIPPGIPLYGNVHRRCGEAVRKKLGWVGRRVVGVVGRLHPVKGQDVFLQAAARLPRNLADTRFLVVGGAIVGHEGAYPERLRQLVRQLGIADRVHFTGHVPDAGPYLDALDVAICPSREEAFGLAVVEALDRGIPVVASSADGPNAILAAGKNGLLVPPEEPAALADAIACVLTDRSLAARLREEGPRRARRFSERRMGSAFERLISEVTAKRSRAPRSGAGVGRGRDAAFRGYS